MVSSNALKNNVRLETKISSNAKGCIPELMYESESWAITKVNEKRTQSSENKFLRPARAKTLLGRSKKDQLHVVTHQQLNT